MTVMTPQSETTRPSRLAPPPARSWLRLGSRTRKAVLIAHLASAAAWLGMSVVFGILTISALSAPAGTPAVFAVAIGAFVGWPLVVVALLTLSSGAVLALGSKYGLFRYWWVTVKLVITIILITLVILVLIPSVAELAGSAATSTTIVLDQQLIFPPVVSSVALLFAISLSVLKPWGRTRREKAGHR